MMQFQKWHLNERNRSIDRILCFDVRDQCALMRASSVGRYSERA